MISSAVSDNFEKHDNFLLLFILIWFFQCLIWVNDKDKASSIWIKLLQIFCRSHGHQESHKEIEPERLSKRKNENR